MKEKHTPWTSGWYAAWRSLLERNIVIRTRIVVGPDYTGCTTRLAMSPDSKTPYVETLILNCTMSQAVPASPQYFAPTSHSDFLANEGRWYRGSYSQAVGEASMSPVAHFAVFEQRGSNDTKAVLPACHPILLSFYGMLHEQLLQMETPVDRKPTLSNFYLRFDAFLYQQQRTVMQQTLGELTP